MSERVETGLIKESSPVLLMAVVGGTKRWGGADEEGVASETIFIGTRLLVVGTDSEAGESSTILIGTRRRFVVGCIDSRNQRERRGIAIESLPGATWLVMILMRETYF